MTRYIPVITHNKHISTPPTWRGFSFALHLLRVQGFCFVILQYSPMKAFTVRFVLLMQLYRPRSKTAHRALQALFQLFAVFCRCRVAGASSYTAPPAPRWSISQHCSTSSAYQIPTLRRTLYSSAQPPYYNKVYKGGSGVPLLWIHTRQCSRSQTMPARRGSALTVCGSLASAAPGASS